MCGSNGFNKMNHTTAQMNHTLAHQAALHQHPIEAPLSSPYRRRCPQFTHELCLKGPLWCACVRGLAFVQAWDGCVCPLSLACERNPSAAKRFPEFTRERCGTVLAEHILIRFACLTRVRTCTGGKAILAMGSVSTNPKMPRAWLNVMHLAICTMFLYMFPPT